MSDTALSSSRTKGTIHEHAIVSKDAIIEGHVSIGCGTVVHPHCTIRVLHENGRLILGEHNVVEENCELVHSEKEGTIRIGNYNTIEIGSTILNSSIGNDNIIGIRSKVEHTTIGHRCAIGPKVNLREESTGDDTEYFLLESEQKKRIRKEEEGKKIVCERREILKRYLNALRDPTSSTYLGEPKR